jgi:uncharacterized SAM-binding protein YcdF (DUF218 family)
MESSDARPVNPGTHTAGLSTAGDPNGPEDLPSGGHLDSPRSREISTRVMAGMAVGTLCGLLLTQLVSIESGWLIVTTSVLFAVLTSFRRFSRVVWGAGVLATSTVLAIAITPLVPWLVQGPAQSDHLEPSDAVVSLGGGMNTDGTLYAATQDRALHALSLLHAGYAPRLVLTGGEAQGESVIRARMSGLGLNFPVENAGPVDNTHDESLAVARLVQSHGWRRVILVTHAWHMRRAAATFRKAGVIVLRSPCPDSGGAVNDPRRLRDRLRILGLWLHESVGYRVYRLRGWI